MLLLDLLQSIYFPRCMVIDTSNCLRLPTRNLERVIYWLYRSVLGNADGLRFAFHAEESRTFYGRRICKNSGSRQCGSDGSICMAAGAGKEYTANDTYLLPVLSAITSFPGDEDFTLRQSCERHEELVAVQLKESLTTTRIDKIIHGQACIGEAHVY